MTGTDRSCGVRSVWTAAVERQRVNGLLVLDRPDINMVCVSGDGDPGRSGRWTARTHKINKTSNNNNTPARAEKFPWPPFPSPSLLPPCACLSVCLSVSRLPPVSDSVLSPAATGEDTGCPPRPVAAGQPRLFPASAPPADAKLRARRGGVSAAYVSSRSSASIVAASIVVGGRRK